MTNTVKSDIITTSKARREKLVKQYVFLHIKKPERRCTEKLYKRMSGQKTEQNGNGGNKPMFKKVLAAVMTTAMVGSMFTAVAGAEEYTGTDTSDTGGQFRRRSFRAGGGGKFRAGRNSQGVSDVRRWPQYLYE